MPLVYNKFSKAKKLLIAGLLVSCILGTSYSVEAKPISNNYKNKKPQIKVRNKPSNNKKNKSKNITKKANNKKINKKKTNKKNSKTNNKKKNIKPKLTRNSVIKYAYKFKGQPYLWGGNKPRKGKKGGFDCSGFVQYVYKHFGVNVGRTTRDQVKHGTPVSRKRLKKGDLVFFGTKKSVYHVGIYVGNNRYIHSPKTGDVVKISKLNRKDYITARRIIRK